MRVVKLGGSLMSSPLLKDWLAGIAEFADEKIVIVPGGGPFANLVRATQKQWQFSDDTAHLMALLAMQQTALLFQGINPGLGIAGTAREIDKLMARKRPVVWSPDIAWLQKYHIPGCWDVTSDSLAAWLAETLQADGLVLVKSAHIPVSYTISELIERNIVDKAFESYVANARFEIKFYHRNQLSLFLGHFKK